MKAIIDPSEILRRYTVLLERLSKLRYPLAITVAVNTNDPLRIRVQDGKPLEQCDLVVQDGDHWDGDIVVTVLASDLNLDRDHIWSLSPWLHERDNYFVDILGEAVLMSHLTDFEAFSAHVAPSAWERGCLSAIHRHYGLALFQNGDDEAASLRFQLHASTIAAVLNQQLLEAADQGTVE